MERTLVIIKPDGVLRGLIGTIISRFEKCGLKIVGMKMAYPDEKLAGNHYVADEEWLVGVGTKQKAAYEKKGVKIDKSERDLGLQVREYLIEYLTMSPVIALCIQGHNAIAHVRKIVGTTSPQDANPGTIRGDFSFDTYQLADKSKRPIQNLIHASGNKKDADRETKIWFTDKEIHDWQRIDEALMYRKGK
ncbi:MAG: nucleoside-diphosphate kinase [Nanoarchaeota archaeon]|nr:nucleoside-diphosphate kinase [Nanoarchaeota archaeon]